MKLRALEEPELEPIWRNKRNSESRSCSICNCPLHLAFSKVCVSQWFREGNRLVQGHTNFRRAWVTESRLQKVICFGLGASGAGNRFERKTPRFVHRKLRESCKGTI
jgi:hypothetical protein